LLGGEGKRKDESQQREREPTFIKQGRRTGRKLSEEAGGRKASGEDVEAGGGGNVPPRWGGEGVPFKGGIRGGVKGA